MDVCESPGTGATECGARASPRGRRSHSASSGRVVLPPWMTRSTRRSRTGTAIGFKFLALRRDLQRRHLGLRGRHGVRDLLMGRRLELRAGLLPLGGDVVCSRAAVSTSATTPTQPRPRTSSHDLWNGQPQGVRRVHGAAAPGSLSARSDSDRRDLEDPAREEVNGVNGLKANPLQNFMPEYMYF